MDFNKRFPVLPWDPAAQDEPVPWIVEGLLQRGRINALFGAEKAGKSRLLGWLLAALYGGQREVFGCRVQRGLLPQRVLYLAGEETQGAVTQRLVRYLQLQAKGADIATLHLPLDIIEAAGMRLDTPAHRAAVEALLREKQYDMLVLEPMRRVHGGDEDSNTAMAPLHNDLRRWASKLGVTVLLVHHTGKLREDADLQRIATWSRGCSDLATLVDGAVFAQEVRRTTRYRKLRLLIAGRFEPMEPLLIEDFSDRRGWQRAEAAQAALA